MEQSAELGRHLAGLLDHHSSIVGITATPLRAELRDMGTIARAGGGVLTAEDGDLALTAGWGHAGHRGIVMPGRGKLIRRDYTPAELTAIEEGAGALGLTFEQALEHLGQTTCDVYLNDVAYWRNVPARVWEYTIGGYQVMKKWLSYRECDLLGRSLTSDEVRYVTDMTRRLAAIVLLEPVLDANYQAIKQSPYPWPSDPPPLDAQVVAV